MKTAEFDPVKALTEMIEGETVSAETRLPPERELAEKFNLSRNELRKALAVLESQNKIWRHVGKGTFIGPKPTLEDGIALPDVSNVTNPSEIMETRLVLEPKIVAIASYRANPNDLQQIAHCLKQSDQSETYELFEKWDEKFHMAIAKSSHNNLLVSLYITVNKLRSDRIWGQLKIAAMNRKRLQEYKRHHQDLMRAIANRDPAKAEKVTITHLESIQKNLLHVF